MSTRPAPDALWYVAYGSNLHDARLQRYLDRGVARGRGPGRPPLDDAPVVLGYRLRFGFETRTWGGGGSAFVDAEPRPGPDLPTLARAWLLTPGQVLDVLAGENGRDRALIDAADLVLEPGASRIADDRRYGLVLGVEGPDDRPALTITGHPGTPATPNPPGEAYVAVVVAGLVQAHGLDEHEARAYLGARIEVPDGSGPPA